MNKFKLSWVLVAFLAMFAGWQMPAAAAGQVNVNTSSAEELQAVKGIGEKTAAAIVAYRTEHGSFKSLDDLVSVKGIGEKSLEKIRPLLTVGEANPCAEANPCSP
ncbi:MAG: ComEA family DNA-binding protein [Mariprofundaceae bacterium]